MCVLAKAYILFLDMPVLTWTKSQDKMHAITSPTSYLFAWSLPCLVLLASDEPGSSIPDEQMPVPILGELTPGGHAWLPYG